LLSGHFEPLMLFFGVVSCVLVAAMVVRLNVLDPSEKPFWIFLRLPTYVPWLLKEIVLSNLDVARRIWHPKLPISPRMVLVGASQKTPLGLVIHANSITLTPGTLSIDANDREILVHALARELAAGFEDSEMDRRVASLEHKAT
jgi:multicomponent Na+:H+ antiporter subunit E